MRLKVSLGQMDIVLGEPQRNLAKVKELTAEAAELGSDILVLPELWSTAYDLENAGKHATATAEGIFAEINALAQEHNLHIVGSLLSRLGENQYGNTLTWAAADGQTLGTYSKIHLFRLMDEDQYLSAGESAAVISTPWGKAGLAICYDLRFPELFRQYALSGAHMIFLPSEWPHPRLMHWRTLLRARAIENQLYMIACNRVGSKGDTAFFGHSCIIDPWGEYLVEGGEEECLLTAEIDTDLVNEVRAKIPIFEDRRPELYELEKWAAF